MWLWEVLPDTAGSCRTSRTMLMLNECIISVTNWVHIISVTVIWNLQHEDFNHNVPQMTKLKTGYYIAYIIYLLHIKATEECPRNSCSISDDRYAGGALIVDICTICRTYFCSCSRAAPTGYSFTFPSSVFHLISLRTHCCRGKLPISKWTEGVTRCTKHMKSQPKLNKSFQTTVDVDWFLKGRVLW